MKFDDLQKALDEWWKDYNHLLGDASGDSECRRKLQRIVKLFSAFRKNNVIVPRKQLEDRMKEAIPLMAGRGFFPNSHNGEYNLIKELLEASK
jgi:hypothetical protein